MNREEIMKLLPHRDHMLLLDDAENSDGIAVGHYTVRGDEFFLKGHFPGNPIVPGVILCEILAQSACVLLGNAVSEGRTPVYTGLQKSCPSGGYHRNQMCDKETKAAFLFCRGNCFCRRKGMCNGGIFFCRDGELTYVLENSYCKPRRNRGSYYSRL